MTSSARSNANLDSMAQSCSQIKTPLVTNPGIASHNDERIIRRSKGARRDFLRLDFSESRGLEPILFHSAIQGAAAQTECFGGLADVALEALQGLPDQDRLHRFEAQFLEVMRLWPLQTQAQIGGLD